MANRMILNETAWFGRGAVGALTDEVKRRGYQKALIVTAAADEKLVKSAANIPGVRTASAGSINTYTVLCGGKFIVSVDAAKKLEEVFAK